MEGGVNESMDRLDDLVTTLAAVSGATELSHG
jgi:hypothetical protein